MAENSIFWTTGSTGDGLNPYTQAELVDFFIRKFFAQDGFVLPGVGNELAVSGTSSPVSIATGAGVVYGFPYESTAVETIAIPTPSASTRIDRIVLRVDWTAQTVRVVRLAGTEGAGAPSLTQSSGSTWEEALAQASITTGGVITVTDERDFAHYSTAIKTSMIDTDAVTLAKMAANSVDTSNIVNRSRQFFIRAFANDATAEAQNFKGVVLPNGSIGYAHGWGVVPNDFVSTMTVKGVWMSYTAGGGNIYREIYIYNATTGEVYNASTAGSVGPGAIANPTPADELLFDSSISLSGVAANDLLYCTVDRQGAHASDTLAYDVYFVGWLVSYTADS